MSSGDGLKNLIDSEHSLHDGAWEYLNDGHHHHGLDVFYDDHQPVGTFARTTWRCFPDQDGHWWKEKPLKQAWRQDTMANDWQCWMPCILPPRPEASHSDTAEGNPSPMDAPVAGRIRRALLTDSFVASAKLKCSESLTEESKGINEGEEQQGSVSSIVASSEPLHPLITARGVPVYDLPTLQGSDGIHTLPNKKQMLDLARYDVVFLQMPPPPKKQGKVSPWAGMWRMLRGRSDAQSGPALADSDLVFANGSPDATDQASLHAGGPSSLYPVVASKVREGGTWTVSPIVKGEGSDTVVSKVKDGGDVEPLPVRPPSFVTASAPLQAHNRPTDGSSLCPASITSPRFTAPLNGPSPPELPLPTVPSWIQDMQPNSISNSTPNTPRQEGGDSGCHSPETAELGEEELELPQMPRMPRELLSARGDARHGTATFVVTSATTPSQTNSEATTHSGGSSHSGSFDDKRHAMGGMALGGSEGGGGVSSQKPTAMIDALKAPATLPPSPLAGADPLVPIAPPDGTNPDRVVLLFAKREQGPTSAGGTAATSSAGRPPSAGSRPRRSMATHRPPPHHPLPAPSNGHSLPTIPRPVLHGASSVPQGHCQGATDSGGACGEGQEGLSARQQDKAGWAGGSMDGIAMPEMGGGGGMSEMPPIASGGVGGRGGYARMRSVSLGGASLGGGRGETPSGGHNTPQKYVFHA